MENKTSCPNCSDLIHELQAEIEEFGEDFVFISFWQKDSAGKEVLTGYMFEEDLDKADLREDERVEAMRAADILAQLQKQDSGLQ